MESDWTALPAVVSLQSQERNEWRGRFHSRECGFWHVMLPVWSRCSSYILARLCHGRGGLAGSGEMQQTLAVKGKKKEVLWFSSLFKGSQICRTFTGDECVGVWMWQRKWEEGEDAATLKRVLRMFSYYTNQACVRDMHGNITKLINVLQK